MRESIKDSTGRSIESKSGMSLYRSEIRIRFNAFSGETTYLCESRLIQLIFLWTLNKGANVFYSSKKRSRLISLSRLQVIRSFLSFPIPNLIDDLFVGKRKLRTLANND